MHIIWKRPDGFQNAQPSDFRRIELSNGTQLWVHRVEWDWYPFQISGDWSRQVDTKKLNRLVNMLDADISVLQKFLDGHHYLEENSLVSSASDLPAKRYVNWLNTLLPKAKGNTWEVEIIHCALSDLIQRLEHLMSLTDCSAD